MKMTLVANHRDWEALYVDGKKVAEGHQIEIDDVMRHIKGIEYKCIERQVPKETTYYPHRLEDIE